jgi:hypothetical protein
MDCCIICYASIRHKPDALGFIPSTIDSSCLRKTKRYQASKIASYSYRSTAHPYHKSRFQSLKNYTHKPEQNL